MFNRKQIVLSAVAAACLFLPVSAVVAQSAKPAPAAKPIKFTLQNKTAAPIDLKNGDQSIHLAAGQAQQVTAPVGTRIVTASDSASSQAGTVIVEVNDGMTGSTVNVR